MKYIIEKQNFLNKKFEKMDDEEIEKTFREVYDENPSKDTQK